VVVEIDSSMGQVMVTAGTGSHQGVAIAMSSWAGHTACLGGLLCKDTSWDFMLTVTVQSMQREGRPGPQGCGGPVFSCCTLGQFWGGGVGLVVNILTLS
jgi:hypothetical protein